MNNVYSQIDARSMFIHKQSITEKNQEFFVGRRDLLAFAFDALAVPGASLAIYGNKGIGKTSYGWQILAGINGNQDLIKRLEIETNFPIPRYYCIWLRCSDVLRNLEGVLAKLLEPSNKQYSLSYTFPKVFTEKRRRTISTTLGVDGPFFKALLRVDDQGKEASINRDSTEFMDFRMQIHNLFEETLFEIKNHPDYRGEEEIIIFLDEFDRITDKTGVGQLLKNLNDARFAIIGTGEDIIQIIEDHASARRKLEGSKIRLPEMEPEEIRQIFERAASIYPNRVFFTDEFINLVTENSGGFPWIAQLLGFHAVLPHQKGSAGREVIIGAKDFQQAANYLASPTGDVERYTQLLRAIGDSDKRERLLFALSEQVTVSKKGFGWIAKKKFIDELQNRDRRNIDHNLSKLVDSGILREDSSAEHERIKFDDPVMAAIVHLAAKRGSLRRSDL
ncbi:MAG: hypothetical protein AAFY20_13305 [Cyanobacteria bacterium J06639_14]